MEDFEMNFDRETMTYSKNIANVVLFAALNALDDISTFTQAEGSNWDAIVVDLFKEFWRFLLAIVINNGQELTEDDYTNKVKNIIIEIDSQHVPEKVSKYKIKSLVQHKLYQFFVASLKRLNSTPDTSSYRLIIHGVMQEFQGKNFQAVYRNEFGLRKRLYDPEYSEVLELLTQKNNENLKYLINYFKNEFELYLRVTCVHG